MQKKIRLMIVEDNLGMIDLIKSYLAAITSNIEICAIANNVQSAIELIHKEQPEILIMDVEIENGTSFEVLSHFPELTTPVIFITAHSHYSLPALKLSAVDFLLKPFTSKEIKSALEKAFQKLFVQSHHFAYQTLLQNYLQKNKFWLVNKYSGLQLNIDEIMYIQADSNYSVVYLTNSKEMVTKTLKEIELIFEGMQLTFLRVHKSYLIQTNYVERIIDLKSTVSILMKNGKEIEVSKRKKSIVLDQLKNSSF